MTTTWYDLTELSSKIQQQTEFQKKFKDSVVGIKHQKRDTPFFAVFIKHKNNVGYIFNDFYEKQIILQDKTEAQVFIPKLEKGYYDTTDNVIYYITKTGYRQWTRGIHPDNTKRTNIFTEYDHNAFPENLSYQQAIISILKKQEIDKHIKQPEISPNWLQNLHTNYIQRLNRDFIVRLSFIHPTGYDLIFHRHCVGWIEQKENRIKLTITNPNFKQEILDSIDSWGSTLSINTL